MPTSTRSKAKAGKRGAKTPRDSVSERKAKRLEDGFTAAERCTTRLGRQRKGRRDARDNRYLTLGEQVLRNPLIRDLSLQDLNPFKLSDLQSVLGLREFYRLLPDVDLKECYFEGAWGFPKHEFVLANWREMSVREMKKAVREALPQTAGRPVYPPCKVDVDTLNTKEDIVRAYWELTYVPRQVYQTAVGGAHVLQSVKAGDVGEDPDVVGEYLIQACCAGLDLPVIRGLAEKFGEGDIDEAAQWAAARGHTDVLDLLVSEFGARVSLWCLTDAATCGQCAMIDHLVERYGVDPNASTVNGMGKNALHWAAMSVVRACQLLVEKHNVDIHARDRYGNTALDLAEINGRTECASFLRELGVTNGERISLVDIIGQDEDVFRQVLRDHPEWLDRLELLAGGDDDDDDDDDHE